MKCKPYICAKTSLTLHTFQVIMHENARTKMELVRNLAEKFYEPGRQDRCWRQVWKRHIYPVYPMCYRTFLRYIRVSRTKPDP